MGAQVRQVRQVCQVCHVRQVRAVRQVRQVRAVRQVRQVHQATPGLARYLVSCAGTGGWCCWWACWWSRWELLGQSCRGFCGNTAEASWGRLSEEPSGLLV